MRLLKRSIYNAAELSFPHALDDIAAKTAISDHHADARAGAAAFRDKGPAASTTGSSGADSLRRIALACRQPGVETHGVEQISRARTGLTSASARRPWRAPGSSPARPCRSAARG